MAQFNPPRAPEQWLSRADMTRDTWGYQDGRMLLGLLPEDGKVAVGRADDRHTVILAGSRSGKSSTLLLPNLRLYAGSVLVIDPKGELARIAAGWRAQFGRVVILDPFDKTKRRGADGWNPFDELALLPSELVPDEAAAIAEALIIEDGRDPHWAQAARNLVRGLILLMMTLDGERSLADLRRFITSGDALLHVLNLMAESDAYDGIVSGLGTSIRDMGDKERGGVISAAATQTGFLDSPGLRQVSQRSSFALSDLAGDAPISVFLVLPSGRMPTHYRWLRLFISMALTAMEQAPKPPAIPCLWMLEEFAQLGHMRALESAAGYMAGYGVKLWAVLQDLSQLKTHYKDGWETFLGNAGIVAAFANTDPSTLEYLSRRMGEVDVELTEQRPTHSDAMRRGDFGEHRRIERRPLLSPSEIERAFPREAGNALILAAGQKPLIVNRLHWEKMS